MPRGVVLLASLLLLALIGMAAVVGVLRPGDSDATGGLSVFTGGDPERGKETIRQSGCAACHSIPGIKGANGQVGPPLDHFARRVYVAGVLPNTPDNLIVWIRDPPEIDPLTVMPPSGLDEAEARDVAAYLYTLD
jgi:cytochrome c